MVEFIETTARAQDRPATAAWCNERGRLWEDYCDVDRHPTMTHAWNSGGFDTDVSDETAAAHEFGLERLLDGTEALTNRYRRRRRLRSPS